MHKMPFLSEVRKGSSTSVCERWEGSMMLEMRESVTKNIIFQLSGFHVVSRQPQYSHINISIQPCNFRRAHNL